MSNIIALCAVPLTGTAPAFAVRRARLQEAKQKQA
jgi:hypothetical protein